MVYGCPKKFSCSDVSSVVELKLQWIKLQSDRYWFCRPFYSAHVCTIDTPKLVALDLIASGRLLRWYEITSNSIFEFGYLHFWSHSGFLQVPLSLGARPHLHGHCMFRLKAHRHEDREGYVTECGKSFNFFELWVEWQLIANCVWIVIQVICFKAKIK